MRLSGRRRDVLEVGVVVKDDRAVMLGHGGGKKIDDARGSVMATRGHPDPNVTRTFSNSLAEWAARHTAHAGAERWLAHRRDLDLNNLPRDRQ